MSHETIAGLKRGKVLVSSFEARPDANGVTHRSIKDKRAVHGFKGSGNQKERKKAVFQMGRDHLERCPFQT